MKAPATAAAHVTNRSCWRTSPLLRRNRVTRAAPQANTMAKMAG